MQPLTSVSVPKGMRASGGVVSVRLAKPRRSCRSTALDRLCVTGYIIFTAITQPYCKEVFLMLEVHH